jgi:putative ABC transport system permease protein
VRLLPFEYGVRNLGRSPARFLLGVAGTALAALLVTAAAAFVRGMGRSFEASADPRNVILVSVGSEDSAERSEIAASVPGIAAASVPTIRRVLDRPLVSPEVNMAVVVRAARDGADILANFRGVTATAYLVHGSVRVTEGRAPGAGEVMAGRYAEVRMGLDEGALAPGRSLWLDGKEWKVSGRFEAPGTVLEAELWTPLQDLRVATRKEKLSTVVLGLEGSDVADVELFASRRLDLELSVLRETEYFERLFAFYRPVRGMVWATAILVAAGAFLGGLNTLHASFAGRIRELAALQVLGWPRYALFIGFLQEALLTAAAGALVGTGLALLLLDGRAVRISMGAFGLAVDGPSVAAGLATGLLLGAVGAVPPAWRCLRLGVAEALKAA